MKLTFLGTGTSQGVPMIGCRCAVCTSADRRDRRLRTSAMVELGCRTGGGHDAPCAVRLVIDAGPDFRYQMLRAGVRRIDAILLTHEHKDHIGGLDDVRALNFVDYPQIHRVDIYAARQTLECVRKDFDYAFAHDKYRGVPEIDLHEIDPSRPFCVVGSGATDASVASGAASEASGYGAAPATTACGATPAAPSVEVIPISGHHSARFEVLGFRIGRLAYLTDFKSIDDSEIEKLKGVCVLVVNALRVAPHDSHFNLAEALRLIERVRPREAYLTHMSHEMGLHAATDASLPEHVHLAYDMLEVEIND